MSGTSFNNVIDNFTSGDTLTITRSFTLPYEAQERGEKVNRAILVVKSNPDDNDADAYLFKDIDSEGQDGVGQILYPKPGEYTAWLKFRFFLSADDTRKLPAERDIFYTIRYFTDKSGEYTGESGRMLAYQSVYNGDTNPKTQPSEPLSELEEVRDLTTRNQNGLPDAKIQSYLFKYMKFGRDQRVLLAAADCIDHLNRDTRWQSQTLGSQSASGNLMPDRAKQLRRRAAALNPFVI